MGSREKKGVFVEVRIKKCGYPCRPEGKTPEGEMLALNPTKRGKFFVYWENSLWGEGTENRRLS